MTAHFSTVMLAIGYVIFWLELYIIPLPQGHTSWLATVLFMIIIAKESPRCLAEGKRVAQIWMQEWKVWSAPMKMWSAAGLILTAGCLMISAYAAFLPVHLIQETDALNYHISLPRQHLILESFHHIHWSSADLWLLPVDFALAPYWLATPWPNKIPQFILFLGLLAVTIKLSSRFGPRPAQQALFVVCALVGSHFVGIQMGTAMLDLALCYLFFAALDSFLDGRYKWAGLEFAFLFWSKPVMPLLWIALAVLIAAVVVLCRRTHSLQWGFEQHHPRLNVDLKTTAAGFAKAFLIFSLFIGGPFVVKSVLVAGTPLFPVGAGMIKINPELQSDAPFRAALLKSASEHMATKDNYGFGRSAVVLPKSLWIMAVPEDGVNNRFDYPIGLPYLLVLGPFIYLFVRAMIKKALPLLPLVVILYFTLWWFGPQQTRFLYIPIVLMFLTVLTMERIRGIVLPVCLVVSLGLTSLSLVGAHKTDWGKRPKDVLRPVDQELMARNGNMSPGESDTLNIQTIAYAGFPVIGVRQSSPFVMQVPPENGL